jgi:NarL family two-component system response regulator LiaR
MRTDLGAETIRVLIVDDHPTVRRGLTSLLSIHSDIEVVGEAEDGATAVNAAVDLSPNVVLLDIKMLGLDGIEIAAQLSHKAPRARVIILTAHDNDEYLLGAFQAGVYAYLLKSSADETVVEAIRQVHQGKRLLSPGLIDQMLRQFQGMAQTLPNRESCLSEEELRVLQQIADGMTNEEIAKEMYWSARTTKRKVEDIIAKLGARNRAQAAVEAVRKGFI